MTDGPDGSFVAVSCLDVASGDPVVALDAERRVYPASTLKLPLLVAAWRAIDAGRLAPDQPVRIVGCWPRDGGAGERFVLLAEDSDTGLAARTGEEASLSELLERMITVSSNEATNLVLDAVGFEAVQRVIGELGGGGCRLRHYFGDRPARAGDRANIGTAVGLAAMMAALGRGEAASSEASAAMLATLAGQTDRALIPAVVPPGARCANKTGSHVGVLHDVALVEAAGVDSYALAVCTSGFDDEEAAGEALRAAARRAHAAVTERSAARRAVGSTGGPGSLRGALP